MPVLLVALVASWIALRAPWRVRYQGRPLADLLAREEPDFDPVRDNPDFESLLRE